MYRSTKKKIVKQASISAVVALGALVTGIGIAGASTNAPHHDTTAPSGRDSVPAPGSDHGRWGGVRGPGGTVTAISSTLITLKDRAGTTETFSIDASTSVTKDRSASTLSALAPGDQVRIMPSAPGSTVAKSIDVEQPSVMGKVTATSANSITVSDPRGTNFTIDVSNATTYSKAGASASLGDVSVGSMIFAQGSFAAGSTTTLDATTVGIATPGAFHDGAGPDFPGAPGRIGPGASHGAPQYVTPRVGFKGLDA